MSAISGGELFQNSVYVGINLQNILYGVELVLYFKTMHTLLNHEGQRTKSDTFYAIFSSVMLLMTTIWISTETIFCGKMWLLNASFPDGTDAFWETNVSVWYIVLATTALVVLQLMTDALMIYRCWVVWNSYRVITVPLILWAGTLVLGILTCWYSSVHGGVFFSDIAVQVNLAYYSLSVFLTAMLTWMICHRILRHGKSIKGRVADEYASLYFAVVVLVVESMLPYTLSGIVLVVFLGLGSQMISIFGYVHALLMCVSPQMLILRVATKTAWTRDTCLGQPCSTIKFSPQEDILLGTVSTGSEELYVPTLGSTPSQNGGDNIV